MLTRLILLIVIWLTACTPSRVQLPDSQLSKTEQPNTSSPTTSMTSDVQVPSKIANTLPLQTQTVTPTPTLESEDMVATIVPGSIEEKMVMLAKEHLARDLGVPVKEIMLSEVKRVQWRDASLGCPKPGIDYVRVETPGYMISLEMDGKTYNYHTDETKRVIRCVR